VVYFFLALAGAESFKNKTSNLSKGGRTVQIGSESARQRNDYFILM
tara:strand:- start:1162 stop:1299 length:138 start_codon:yes stop_codon:yes gene_type:complete